MEVKASGGERERKKEKQIKGGMKREVRERERKGEGDAFGDRVHEEKEGSKGKMIRLPE